MNLNRLNLPKDIKKLNYDQCNRLCQDIRTILIDTVSKNGGHLASNLGTVELTVAIHRAFNSPKDKIVWDVGHQSYTHKLLTGRYKDFNTLRKEGGLSGFPKPSESEHDAFISGHSSTSISLACGMAQVMKLKNQDNYAVAVIGDGAFTGGLAYEGLNNGGNSDLNLIIILNQNDMSISENTGAIANYFSKVRQREGYVNTKLAVKKTLDKVPLGKNISNVISRSKGAVKGALFNNNIFEALGYIYIGIVDGHNIEAIEKALNTAKMYRRPVVVHVHTTKGKGYRPAEVNPNEYHGVSNFDVTTGKQNLSNQYESYSSAFGKKVIKLGDLDENICTITAAMKENTGLSKFAEKYPNRFFDVGIAEQHAVTFASGMSSMGMIPIFAVYSTFLQRAYDQLIHDVAIANTHIVLAIDRAGIVGDDGETHQGIFDVAFLSEIPNCTIYSPACIDELNWSFDRAVYHESGLSCVRYPRGVDKTIYPKQKKISDYFLDTLSKPSNTLIVTYGRVYDSLYKAKTLLYNKYKISVDTLKLTKIYPIPNGAVQLALNYSNIIFFEEGIQSGGLAEHFLNELSKRGFNGRYTIRAIDGFVYAGTVQSCLERYSLTSQTMYEYIKNNINIGKADTSNES